jgi:hypothetical protein
MLHQVSKHTVYSSPCFECIKYLFNHRLRLLVRIFDHFAGRPAYIARRWPKSQLPAASFLHLSLKHSLLEYVQLGLAHGALKAQQQTVVVIRRIVYAIEVRNQRPEDRAYLQ